MARFQIPTIDHSRANFQHSALALPVRVSSDDSRVSIVMLIAYPGVRRCRADSVYQRRGRVAICLNCDADVS